jgi:hypothetical protein
MNTSATRAFQVIAAFALTELLAIALVVTSPIPADGTSGVTFEEAIMSKDLGQCTATTAERR